MSVKLRIKDFVQNGDAYHFARVEIGRGKEVDVHSHDFHELFWVESGKGTHWIDGTQRPVESPCLIFVLPEDIHTVGTSHPDEKMVICNLAFSSRIWLEVVNRHLDRKDPWFCVDAPEQRERRLFSPAFEFLRRAGMEMMTISRSRMILERFFLNLWVALQAKTVPSNSHVPSWLSDGVLRTERDGLFRLGPTALTRLCGRSQEHVVRECRRWLRKTPTMLINEMRMRHAATCLSTTQREALDICYECGFENVGYFYTLFHKCHGMTPRRYRLLHQSIVRPL